MADSEFLLRIKGDDVGPRRIEVEDLYSAIRGFRGAIASIASNEGADEDDVFLSLVGLSYAANNISTLTLYGSQQSLR